MGTTTNLDFHSKTYKLKYSSSKEESLIRKNKKPHRFSGGVFQFPFCLKERIKV
ncbi:hypothetical protein LEP1GSC008_4072 [Leptospira kirschneri serovar Bulgarica str. Nikolaevo]|uniref:Uncharacterized protein n=1 Tax=Leptospira kirschneri serovar Bulgarica str. Nikolaevo TaxID=1240687 RepID=M6FC61_9LEPT|nr:hypothetical protein LEP1GSC008_4072 [Leptospira kirschneri serovar Bulgarica str. Nikolaevo]